ncbi:hypothetical protein [Persephonella hydrogeniphila]|uniref:hypothetical protein n=1 Tax=Persephonella hydrogeniphila TaxID=198703 RepID=UPI000BE292AC|nr:hypothetical protein [Persephonella hydrogeniphila]
MKKVLEEFGKLFLNMALASFVFSILQPFVMHKLDITALIGASLWLVFSILGGYLLYKAGGYKDEY